MIIILYKAYKSIYKRTHGNSVYIIYMYIYIYMFEFLISTHIYLCFLSQMYELKRKIWTLQKYKKTVNSQLMVILEYRLLLLVPTTEQNNCEKNLIIKIVGEIITTFNQTFNPFSANRTKWSNTLKQFVGKLPTNIFQCL